MLIVKRDKRWMAFTNNRDETTVLKKAGFTWCKYAPDPETGKMYWFTNSIDRVCKLYPHADDACRGELQQEYERLQRALEASRATDADVEIPVPDGLEYMPFQKAGIAFATSRYTAGKRGVLIGDEPGLGKTIQTIGIINSDDRIERALIICPATLRINWQRELEKWLVKKREIGIANGDFFPNTQIVVINYDICSRHSESLKKEPWDLLVCDESHLLKSGDKTIRGRAILGHLENAKDANGKWTTVVHEKPIPSKRVLFLTGTPIVNRPSELWPQIHALDPGVWKSKWGFLRRYADAHQTPFGWDVKGASNLEELQEKLRTTIMVRRLKSEVLKELPPKRRQIVPISSDGMEHYVSQEWNVHAAHEQEINKYQALVELSKAVSRESYEAAVAALRQAIAVSFEDMSRARMELAMAKVPKTVEFVTDTLGDEKLLVFAHHREVIESLSSELDKAGILSVYFHGDHTMERRQEAIDKFRSDPKVQAFVISIGAGGLGITLTEASRVIFHELDWVPGRITQAEDRACRIGQVQSVLVQHLVLDGSLDARMATIIVEKQDVADRSLDKGVIFEVPVIPSKEKREIQYGTWEEVDAAGGKITKERSAAIHVGLRALEGRDADWGKLRNDVGFSGVDALVGHSLAETYELTPKQAALGLRILQRYKYTQLPILMEESDYVSVFGKSAKDAISEKESSKRDSKST